MGGVNLSEVQPHDGYSCPWCPTIVLVTSSQVLARVFMERHLDAHVALGIAEPTSAPTSAPHSSPLAVAS